MANRDVIFASATVFLTFVLGGCSGPASSPAQNQANEQKSLAEKETVARAIKGKYDDKSLRFEGDLIVIDLVLANSSSFELANIDIAVEVSPSGIAKWKKQVQLSKGTRRLRG